VVCAPKEVNGGTFSSNAALNLLRGCTKINGDLNLRNFEVQIDFSVFNCLQEITGYFGINVNAKITTISGFGNLEKVGGYFNIRDNAALKTISGFGNLETVGGFYNIYNNALLNTISGFVNLQTVGGNFSIFNSGGSVVLELGVTVALTISGFGKFKTTVPKGITSYLIVQGASINKLISISPAIKNNMINGTSGSANFIFVN